MGVLILEVAQMPVVKLLTLSEAIDRFVPDGSSIAMGLSQETLIPFAAGIVMSIHLCIP
jgi:hypothetical protein